MIQNLHFYQKAGAKVYTFYFCTSVLHDFFQNYFVHSYFKLITNNLTFNKKPFNTLRVR